MGLYTELAYIRVWGVNQAEATIGLRFLHSGSGIVSIVCLGPGVGGLLGSIFAGYVPLDSQNPYPIIVCSVANY